MSGYTGLPPIVDSFLSSGIFRNAVCLFINKQHAKILAKEGAEKDFRNLSDLQKESICFMNNMFILWRYSTKLKLQFQVLSHALHPFFPPLSL